MLIALALLLAVEDPAPKVVWRVEARHRLSTPLVHADRVLATEYSNQSVVRAFDKRTGEPIWTAALGTRSYLAPVADDDRVFVPTDQGLVALKFETGERLWPRQLPGVPAAACALDEKAQRVYFGTNDGFFRALDARTGEELWKVELVQDADLPAAKVASGSALLPGSRARPEGAVIADGTASLAVFDQGRAFAVDAQDGRNRRFHQTNGWLSGGPCATGDVVVFGSQDQHLHCLDRRTFEPKWTFKTSSWPGGNIVADDQFVFTGACDGVVYAVDRRTGAEVWKHPMPRMSGNEKFAVGTTVRLEDERLWVWTDEGHVATLDRRDGKKLAGLLPLPGERFHAALDRKLMFFVEDTRWDSAQQRQVGKPALIAVEKPQ